MSQGDAAALCFAYEDLGLGSFWTTDGEGRLTYMSSAAQALLGGGEDGLIGRPFLELFLPPDREAEGDSQRALSFALARRGRFERVIARSEAGGRGCWWSISGEPQSDGNTFTGFRGHCADITGERESAEESSRLAMHDPLTGLLNRRRMTQVLERTLTAYALQRRSCAIMLIDLDRFKQVNDTLGHAAGDALLKQVADRLVKIVGDKEKVCRLGGDEFQVILPDQEDRGVLGDMATSIISSISQPYSIEGSRCTIGASVGVAVAPFDGQASEELVRNADLALYAAKGSGRGRFRFFSNDLLKAAEDRRVLEEDLIDALPKGQLELHYQPIVKATSNQIVGMEALLRWNHPEQGWISPARFIPIAEESHLICRIGEWVLRKACEDAASWPGDARVAVNVSPIQFADSSLPALVASALASSGLEPDRLELEITEGVFLQEGGTTDAMFRALKDLGVRLALDDFGTGYSSLAYLKTAPFDKIKIDQSFVRGATGSGSRNRAIIAAIVALAKALDMETTAEGVESFDQFDLMKSLEVSHVQGFIYSPAITNEDFLARLDGDGWIIAPSGPARQRHDRQAMFRRIGAIHEDHYYPIVLRNLSVSGALIEGMVDVPLGTKFVLDLGDGQLVIATVRRSRKHQQGVEFEQEMVADGNGGLCTRHRVSPYALTAAGLTQTPGHAGPMLITRSDDGRVMLPAFSLASEWNGAALRTEAA
ncbi:MULTISPECIES: bifunctional diguanylate cyclase/phosphodiesterase [unclassified Novosphingobium]|jgi:diguanylate cyclase (GGDEF)-like protein/PAS domain S-box-containing protein|nr:MULTISPECIES: EAL domain-containing protein [unclassified Novosphingobium]MBF5090542.1 EAL domain-containing protein [Novosphingobium sp. NBM11]RQW42514.1 EAL domain-containing protein [Novosphingobium sp. LASN5T]